MSRNLCRTNCYYCPGIPKLDEAPRAVTREECGVYFDEYEGMLVANATCPLCEAKYLAWVDETTRVRHATWGRGPENYESPFVDLSFRSSFNDEPGPDDLPKWRVETQHVRVGPYDRANDPYARPG